jgi:hypothetical protein
MKFILLLISLVSINAQAKIELNRSVINEKFKQAIIVDEVEIHFDEQLINLPIKVSICVGQDRRFSRTVKMLGCQNVKAEELISGKVILDSVYFSQANPTRNLVYFFNWKTIDLSAENYQESSVFVIFQR